MAQALELAPAALGLAEAPWPPAAPDKRGVPVKRSESFLDVCSREKVDFARLIDLNFGIDIRSPRLAGKWQKLVNYYLRTRMGSDELTPGGNYRFKDGATIYVPTGRGAPIDLGETIVVGRPPETSAGRSALKWSDEIEFKSPDVRGANNAVVWKVSLAGKFKWAGLKSDAEGKFAIGNTQVGAAIARKLTDDISIQAGTKLKWEDLAKGDKGFVRLLRENMEATVKARLSTIGNASFYVEAGLNASTTPFVLKLTGTGEGTLDLPDPISGETIPIAYSASVTVTFQAGPSPALVQRIGSGALSGAGAVAVFYIGFIALGIWDYGRRVENAEKIGLLSEYVLSYEATVFGSVPGYLGPDPGGPDAPERLRLAEAGRRDAREDAARMFGGSGEDPLLTYLRALFAVNQGRQGDRERVARNCLELMIWTRLEERTPGLSAPKAGLR
ncbi:hypothetical protein [Prosthecomicrobium sp. N25]|uniref:hypothetical protein n=1 Tax=Prosthecomicrobium sp. N25 TaxID=3129254 RepID=UPI0030789EF1